MLKICLIFIKKTIKRLCENFFDEKLVMIVCAAKDGTWEAVDEDSTKKKLQIPQTCFRTKRNNE